MGVPESSGSRNSLMMKSLFIVGGFLAAYAVAEAEPEAAPNAEANADPWYAYSGYGLGHYGYRPYYRGYYRPYGYGYWGSLLSPLSLSLSSLSLALLSSS